MNQRPNFLQATLVERIHVADDLAVFRFQPETPLEFIPGQYATLGMEDGEKFIQRPYSVVSSPLEHILELYVELVPNGIFTPRLWDMKPNDHIFVKNKIIGAFVLQEKFGLKHHVMASTVTGVGPSLSIARTQKMRIQNGSLESSEAHHILVVQGASRSWELGIYHEEMTALAAEYEWFHYAPTISRPWEDAAWTGETGRAEEVLRKYMGRHDFNAENSIGYCCGHPQMIENVKGLLTRARFPKEHIKEEKYFTIRPNATKTAAEPATN